MKPWLLVRLAARCQLTGPAGTGGSSARRILRASSSGAGDSRNLIRLIGDPILANSCAPVTDLTAFATIQASNQLLGALEKFRHEHGFGRGISAPQIGLDMRMIALHLGATPFVIFNPEILALSDESFSMWDDCMSFPDYLVRVRRRKSLRIRYSLADGRRVTSNQVSQAVSELLQHEMDHLDGICAFDRADGVQAVVHRKVYEANQPFFDATVDYKIVSTIGSTLEELPT
jgi:peptide deformylase